jgi:hypothetical protein
LSGIAFLSIPGSAQVARVYQTVQQARTTKADDVRNAAAPLVSGQSAVFAAPAVTSSTLFTGDNEFTINVPSGATRLDVKLSALSAADLDLFVRFAQPVAVASGQVVSDLSASTFLVDETVSLSAPLLQPGIYYIAVAAYSGGGAPILATVTATVSGSIPTNALAGSQFVTGDGWATSLFVSNLSTTAEAYSIRLFADDGTPMPVGIQGLATTDTISGTLKPGETAIYATSDSAKLQVGWASVIPATPNTSRLSGFAVFRNRVTGQKDTEAISQLIGTTGRKYIVLYDNVNGFQTGLAISNSNSLSAINVQVTVRDSTGLQVGTYNQILPPRGHAAIILSSGFPTTANRRGSMLISADQPGLGALGLRFSPAGPFTSFPALTSTDLQ